jgi:hypothetical protein
MPVLIGALVGTCLMLVSACGTREERQVVDGEAVSAYSDPFTVAGLPITDGPNGLRDNAEQTDLDVRGGDGGEIDDLMTAALADLQAYWEQAFEPAFKTDFKTGLSFVSWDAESPQSRSVLFCNESTFGQVNAAFCPTRDEIGWDRGVLMPALSDAFGPMAPVTVIAH